MPLKSTITNISVPFNNTVVKPSNEQRSTGIGFPQLTELAQSLYSLVLYDTVENATLIAPGLDPAGRTANAEYFFRVAPKVHEFDEPFATTIQGTQDGGKYVESYGSIIKSLRISGTTGLRPNKAVSGTIPLLGVTDAQLMNVLGSGLTNAPRTLATEEKTGYDDIIFLRNLFRHYSDLKSSDALASRVVLLWRNIKDADYWIIEPDDFRLSQNSQSPLTYEYSISAKTLSRYDFSFAAPSDPLEAGRSARRMLSRLQEYGQNITNIFLTISTQITRVQGLATFVSNTVLAPMVNLVNGLNAVKTSAYGVVRGLRAQALLLRDNVEIAINNLLAVTTVQDPIIRSLHRTKVLCARILTEPVASESSVKEASMVIHRYAAAYETPGTITTPRRAPNSSPSYIGNEDAVDSVSADLVREDETIRDIAQRLLGDPNRWQIIATLNNLRAPFTSPNGGPGILQPGDSVLFPRAGVRNQVGSLAVNSQNMSNNESQGTGLNTPVQQSYGRDLMLKSVTANPDLTDLVINQRGDIGSIQGLPNVEQALRIKFMTEKGELPAHTGFGAKFPIGRKLTSSSFNELRINTINTLISDSRVADVPALQFVAVADTLAVSAEIKLTETRDVLTTSFALRRF